MVGWICVTVCWFVTFELIGVVLNTSASTSPNRDGEEVCESETFEPSCAENEVIMIVEAQYGRMRLGRCAQVDYGYIGCYADVLEHLDSLCSGRRTCSLRIPDSGLDKAKATKCPREFKTYLNASYKCIEVESSGCRACGRSGQELAHTTQPSAFIGSIVSAESRVHCGSSKCPWNIEVPSGQTINITLFDFAMEQRNGEPPSPDKCYRYAVIKERQYTRDTPVCGGHGRQQLIYTSVSNSVEVHIVSTEVFSRLGQFILYYEAVGCPDIAQPEGSILKRHGDRVEVRCRSSDQKWERHCVGNAWVGELGTCPDRRSDVTPNPEGVLSVGLLTAIVIGIALVIAVCIVTVGLVYIKRQHRELQRPEATLYVRPGQCIYELREPMPTQPLPESGTLTIRKPTDRVPKGTGQVVRLAAGRRNLYDAPRLMESRPLPSIPNLNDSGCGSGDSVRMLRMFSDPAASTSMEQFSPHHRATPRTASGSGPKPMTSSQEAKVPGGPPRVKGDTSQVPLVPCAVGPGIDVGLVPQHYTVLDPNEVRQLMHSGTPVAGTSHQMPQSPWSSGAMRGGDQTACTSACSYPSSLPSHTDDCSSSTSGEEGHPLNGASNEIPLRPMREVSQPKIDSSAAAAPWSGEPKAEMNNSGNNSWP